MTNAIAQKILPAQSRVQIGVSLFWANRVIHLKLGQLALRKLAEKMCSIFMLRAVAKKNLRTW